MSPRRAKRRPERGDGSGEDRAPGAAFERVEEHDDGDWVVRSITGSSSTKTYRCPGCNQEIRPATPHLVVWPADGYGTVDDRRHWHKGCWAKRANRGPTTERSRNAPRH